MMWPASKLASAHPFPLEAAGLLPLLTPQSTPTGFVGFLPSVPRSIFYMRSTAVRNARQQIDSPSRSLEISSKRGACIKSGRWYAAEAKAVVTRGVEPDGNATQIVVKSNLGDIPEEGGGKGSNMSPKSKSNNRRGQQWQGRELFTIPSLFLAVSTACSQGSSAAVTGGRIGGGYTPPPDRAPSAPPMEQQQRYQSSQQQQQYYRPRAGRDIYGSDGSRVHIKFDSTRGGRRSARTRFDPDAGDVPSGRITPGDIVMVGGVSAGVAAVQRYNRKRLLENEGEYPSPTLPTRASREGDSKQEAVVTSLQLSLYCDRRGGQGDLLATLGKLSQTADVNSPRGLSALINEVCLAMLRSQTDWIGGTGGVKTYFPDGSLNSRGKKSSPASRAKRDFNRATMRERSKWERETVSNTPDRGFSSSTVPSWDRTDSQKDGTYAVVTLLIAWAGLRSNPPQAETRRGAWFQQGGGRGSDRGSNGFSVVNRSSAVTLLEWLGDEAAEGRGENVLDVEVLWTPADDEDSLDRDDLDTKWPELRAL